MNDRDTDRAEAVRVIAEILADAYRTAFARMLRSAISSAAPGGEARRTIR
jgi:hypothetical protein